MSSANVDGMLREGVNALKSGRRDEARALLLRAVELDQYNEEAWLWLSGVLDSLEDQRTCLENVLSINPENDRARQGLDYINKQLGTSPQSSAPSQMGSPGGLATSVEWGTPGEGPPSLSQTPPSEPSAQILDDWVTNLNIPAGGTPSIPVPAKPTTGASPFGDVDLGDDDFFASGPFKADSSSEPEATDEILSPAERTARRRAKSEARQARRTGRDASPAPSERMPAHESSSLFPGIPAEIAASRLPGTVERTPILISLLIFVFVIGNIAAAVILAMSFFG